MAFAEEKDGTKLVAGVMVSEGIDLGVQGAKQQTM